MKTHFPAPCLFPNEIQSPPDRFDTEPVVGWRYWFATKGGHLLSTAYHDGNRWPGRAKLAANCERWATRQHASPYLMCSCGIHAWKSGLRAGLAFNLSSENVEGTCPPGLLPVYGQVSLWGRVIEHEEGYRAQFAYPYMLRVMTEPLADRLRTRYGVDVEVLCEAD